MSLVVCASFYYKLSISHLIPSIYEIFCVQWYLSLFLISICLYNVHISSQIHSAVIAQTLGQYGMCMAIYIHSGLPFGTVQFNHNFYTNYRFDNRPVTSLGDAVFVPNSAITFTLMSPNPVPLNSRVSVSLITWDGIELGLGMAAVSFQFFFKPLTPIVIPLTPDMEYVI